MPFDALEIRISLQKLLPYLRGTQPWQTQLPQRSGPAGVSTMR